MARLSPRLLAPSLLLVCLACATVPGPLQTAEAYSRALEEGRWADAAALSDDSESTLESRYGEGRSAEEREARRKTRARAIREARSFESSEVSGFQLRSTEQGWRIHDAPGDADEASQAPLPRAEAARASLRRFLEAAGRGDFTSAWSLLSAPLRARYTPERFAADFQEEPLAQERLTRAGLAAAKAPVLSEDAAVFPIGEGKEVRLLKEPEGWRVEALE